MKFDHHLSMIISLRQHIALCDDREFKYFEENVTEEYKKGFIAGLEKAKQICETLRILNKDIE